MKIINTLTKEEILKFAQELHPKITEIQSIEEDRIIYFKTKSYTIIAPIFETPQTFGFRSLLKITGKTPTWIFNGQASKGTKEIKFFGENGPLIKFRDKNINENSNFHTIWGVEKVIINKLFSNNSSKIEKFKKENNPEKAIEIVLNQKEKIKDYYIIQKTISYILERSKISMNEIINILFNKNNLEEDFIIGTLRNHFKITGELIKLISNKGIPPEKIANFCKKCEYPQTLAREFKSAGLQKKEILNILKKTHKISENSYNTCKKILELEV